MKTTTLAFCCIFVFTISFHANSQPAPLTCKDIQNGIFYNYPKNSSAQYIDERNGDIAKESDLLTGDSSLWKITWPNQCTYILSYLGGNIKMTDEMKKFVKEHKLAFKIGTITDEYYTFTGYIDKPTNPVLLTDTMWMHEKLNVTSNELFVPIKNNYTLKKNHFSDTSKYAVLYVYRPGAPGNWLTNYLLYFDDNILCVAKNNSAYIFKILKEGNFKILSRLNKDVISTPVNIKFGQKYYLRTIPNWGFFKFKNYKLETTVVDQDRGEKEFSQAILQY
jgi:hypothetical protein